MSTPSAIQPFEDFRDSLSSAKYPEVRERLALKPDDEAFDEMREFLLTRYEGVDVRHSFLESGGEVVDCIPAEQQLSLRDGSEVPEPPSEPPLPDTMEAGDSPGATNHLPPQLHPRYYDPLGNQMWCPLGTVPVLRHTLDRLATDHPTLDELLRGPRADTRRWAAGRQEIENLGGASNINIWTPQLIPPSLLSSASQQWYSNAGLPFVPYQTVECGWRAGIIDGAPGQTDSLPRLFVFYTRDDYKKGNSCYNDYCQGGFAYHPGANHVLHGALSPTSQQGGTQYDIRMGFTLTGGRWWFHIAGAWIGSYPASLFSNGTLGTSARTASFGGETTAGFGVFPTMGSGRFPTEGFGKAAYQRTIAVNDMTGVARHAQLTAGQVSPACYNSVITNNSSTEWGSYLYFGGPGGLNCP
ncbi:MAG: neprosin family prolyl endopeptidase [Actinophytocola sp.]|uniref:neprosin family prolyl endopeptidase n=1 Tax=Actinophytocola sp. TaxID=1872138 RepID=UPI003D6AB350